MPRQTTIARSTGSLLLTLLAVIIGLPLLGVALDGRALSPYLEFPPQTTVSQYAPFSWPVFIILGALIGASLAPFIHRVLRSRHICTAPPARARGFPVWGWAGLVLMAASWALAWARFEWFAPLQRHTFTPLWLSFIVVVNALTYWRTGRCMLTDRPRVLLALFPLSAAFWWFFEYLNRFVQNWHYVGVEHLDAWQYFWEATLPFSTVLPAVLSARDWLATFPRLKGDLERAWPITPARPRAVAIAALAAAGAVLAGIGVWPGILFPALWLAPLVILVALQALWGRHHLLEPLARGDWRGIWLAALAALVCGVFWELWNVNSLAHWRYTIPYVHRFAIFEMPLLGYAGYLPFGLQCVAVACLVDADAIPFGRSTNTTQGAE